MIRRYSNLIGQHEAATKRYAKADPQGPDFRKAHTEFVQTGLTLDEYVQNLEQLAENQQRDAERLPAMSHQSETAR